MVKPYVVLVEVLNCYRVKTIWSDRRWKEVEIANHPVGTFVRACWEGDAHGFLREVGQLRGGGGGGSNRRCL